MYNFKMKINKNNLIHNFSYLKSLKKKEIIAVIKSNAYGHGMENIATILSQNGCDYFAVARLNEAKKILDLNLTNIKVLVFESVLVDEYVKSTIDLELSVNNYKDLTRYLESGISPSRLHIKLELGFSRNGISVDSLATIKTLIGSGINFKGIYTHIFAATYEDIKDIENTFSKVIYNLGNKNFSIIHLQNSSGVLSIDSHICTHLRCGLLLYGLQEIGYFDPNLKQVFSLQGEVYGTNFIDQNKYIAYELKNSLNLDNYKYIAKIKIGYGDGFSKRNTNSFCLINNKEFRIVEVTMDTTFIAVDSSVKEGDKATLLNDLNILSKHLEIPHYEIISMINDRIPRVII